MNTVAATEHRSPTECATMLDAPAAEIDKMSMDDRREFVQQMRSGPATRLGAGERWRNIEGVIMFFRDHGLGAPGTWVSHVNAGVLEGIERGIAIALDPAADDFGNVGAQAWASYLTQLRGNELGTKTAHDTAWSEAKEVSTDYGLALAEKVHGLSPTEPERRFLRLAQLYNWGMRNRPVVDTAVSYGGLVDRRLKGLRTEHLDWLMNVGDTDAARKGCEIAWTVAQMDPSPDAISALDIVLNAVPQLLDVFQPNGNG